MNAEKVLKKYGTSSVKLNERLSRCINAEVASGRQRAVTVCAYYKGEEICFVGGGWVRTDKRSRKKGEISSSGMSARSKRGRDEDKGWEAVKPSHLFGGFSLSKGVTAAALLTTVDDSHLSWDQRVSDVWPEAGDDGCGSAKVSDLASHRGEVPLLVECLLQFLFVLIFGAGVWPLLWGVMTRYTLFRSRWHRATIGRFARYHQVSFSYYMVPIIEGATKLPFGRYVRERIVATMGLAGSVSRAINGQTGGQASSAAGATGTGTGTGSTSGGGGGGGGGGDRVDGGGGGGGGGDASRGGVTDGRLVDADDAGCRAQLFLGGVPPQADERVVRIEQVPCGASSLVRTPAVARRSREPDGTLARWLLLHVVAPIEGFWVSLLCNLSVYRRLLLPSSNGFFTARAVCRLYGALAAGGAVAAVDPITGRKTMHRLARADTINEVVHKLSDPSLDVEGEHPDTGFRGKGDALPARLSSGWFPWASAELHGERAARAVINSEGMGGNASWADPTTGLAVCVLKSVYEPLSALGGSVSPDVVRIAAELRVCLGIAEAGDEAWVAKNDEEHRKWFGK